MPLYHTFSPTLTVCYLRDRDGREYLGRGPTPLAALAAAERAKDYNTPLAECLTPVPAGALPRAGH